VNSLARGRWPGLVAYAVAPWLLSTLCNATGLEPWNRAGTRARPLLLVLRLGVVLAIAGAFVPSIALVAVAVGLGLVLGSLLVGGARSSLRAVAVAAGASALGAVLLFPWSLHFVLPGREWSAFAGAAPAPAHAAGFGALLRFNIGPVGGSPLGWAFVVAASLPLLIGRGWRLAWAVRLWSVALTCVAFSWAASRGWVFSGTQLRDAMLGPAALALAGSAALGMLAFETDLLRYRFGWRQLASVIAGVAAVFGVLALLPAAASGRWYMPVNDIARSTSWMNAEAAKGSFRVLWVGDPDVLPGNGWSLDPGLAYATSRNGPPDAGELWPGSSAGPTQRIADAVTVARDGRTTRLGHLLAPMAIRYIAVPRRLVPGQASSPSFPVPTDVVAGLAAQLDLRELPSDPALLVYENTAWGPLRAATTAPPNGGLGTDLSGAQPVLPGHRAQVTYQGPIPASADVLVSEASGHWTLSVGGHGAPHQRAFGFANRYPVNSGGKGTLRYGPPFVRYLLVIAELVLWFFVIRAFVRARRQPWEPNA
jgi:hypothetical protein